MKKRRSSNVYMYNSTDPVLHFDEIKRTSLKWIISRLWLLLSLFEYFLFISIKVYSEMVRKYFSCLNFITSSEKRKKVLKEWIENKVQNCKILNFNEDFKDGIILCALMETIVPGSCPRFDLLNQENAKNNVQLFLNLLRKHLNIMPEINAQQIVDGICEDKLINLLSKMKLASSKMILKSILKQRSSSESNHKKTSFEQNFDDERKCFAKGMGLILALKAKKARFNIFHEQAVELDLILEIEGANHSFCRERITNKRSRWNTAACEYIRCRTSRYETIAIPVYYDIFENRISVTYIPIEVGKHKLSIVCQGQHIMGSPFSVAVDDSIEMQNYQGDINFVKPLINLPGNSRVVRKRIIRQTMLVNGVETPINENRELIDHKKSVELQRKSGFPQILSVSKLMKDYDVIDTEDPHIDDPHITLVKCDEKIETEKELKTPGSGDESQKEMLTKQGTDITCDKSTEFNLLEIEQIKPSLKSFIATIPNSCTFKKHCNVDLRHSSLDELLSDYNPENESVEVKFQELVETTNKESDTMPSNFSLEDCVCASKKPIVLETVSKRYLKTPTTLEPVIIHRAAKEVTTNSDKKYTSVKNRRKMFEQKVENNLNEPPQSCKIRKEIGEGFNVKERKRFWESLNNQNSEKSSACVASDVMKESRASNHETNRSSKTSNSQADSGISGEVVHVDKSTEVLNTKLIHKYRSVSYPNLRNDYKHGALAVSLSRDWYSMQLEGKSLSSSTAGFIDDEIPYFASLLEETEANSVYTKSRDSVDLYSMKPKISHDFNVNTKDKGIYPENCFVSGSGIYDGKVGVKNRFKVCTKYAGRSFLSVGIQGMEEDDLLYVTMTYIGDSQYEVVYEVTRAGYFIIFVRFGDWNVADSPFICKVTF